MNKKCIDDCANSYKGCDGYHCKMAVEAYGEECGETAIAIDNRVPDSCISTGEFEQKRLATPSFEGFV